MSLVTSTQVENADDEQLDVSLRPRSLREYIGQEKMKENLIVSLQAAKMRSDSLDHLLFYGPPGLGKTTISHVIANEMGVSIRVTSGPAIERAGDLASILTNLQPGDILFIDEIHRLSRVVEEILYPAMEDFALDIVIGKGPSARNVRLDLPKFTIIGATTRIGLLSSPLRDRFGIIHRLEFYSDDALFKIILRAAEVLNVSIERDAASELSRRSRGTPRIANRLLKRVRDFGQVKHGGKVVDKKIVDEALEMLDVDHHGLDGSDRRVLQTIVNKFGGGPVGIETLAAALSEDTGTLEDVLEPFLLQKGFLQRTPRGRVVTELGKAHVKK
jgi:holliday junction DNA helicase RuvB